MDGNIPSCKSFATRETKKEKQRFPVACNTILKFPAMSRQQLPAANHLAHSLRRLREYVLEESRLRRLVVAQTLAEIDALRPAWERLYEQTSEATLFQSFSWNRMAAAIFPHEQPYVLL